MIREQLLYVTLVSSNFLHALRTYSLRYRIPHSKVQCKYFSLLFMFFSICTTSVLRLIMRMQMQMQSLIKKNDAESWIMSSLYTIQILCKYSSYIKQFRMKTNNWLFIDLWHCKYGVQKYLSNVNFECRLIIITWIYFFNTLSKFKFGYLF